MPAPTYVFGHRNPDADAICSALAYADFKRRTTGGDFRAARCGNSNARIDAILDHFGVPLPPFISDVTPRLRDQMTSEVVTVGPGDTCARALELIDEHDFQLLPVVRPDRTLLGTLSIFQLGEYFIPKSGGGRDIRRVESSLDSVISALDAGVLHVERAGIVEPLWVRVAAMDLESFRRFQSSGDIPPERSVIVVGDRSDIQRSAIELGVRLLVVTGGLEVDAEIVERAKARGTSIISSDHDTATTAWTIRTAARVDSVMGEAPTRFSGHDPVDSVRRRTSQLDPSVFMVTDEGGRLEGVFTRRDLLRPSGTQLILVDHNELSQAVAGADQVQIVEVVDHHRLGDLRTEEPILFINRPVGSTCTIVADKYRAAKLTPSREMAGMLMGGLVSDTLNLRSPTTTAIDTEILGWLEEITGVTGTELAEIIFSSGSVVADSPPAAVLALDRKEYEEGGRRFAISQVEELGFDRFWERAEELSAELERFRGEEQLDFAILMVTDVKTQDSLLVVKGGAELIDAISYPAVIEREVFRLSGVVSRKKQLLPFITGVLKRSQPES